jgi:hypothetical protein
MGPYTTLPKHNSAIHNTSAIVILEQYHNKADAFPYGIIALGNTGAQTYR